MAITSRLAYALALIVPLEIIGAGCGPRHQFSYAIDPTFTGDERDRIEIAAGMWNDQCHVEIGFRDGFSPPEVVVRGLHLPGDEGDDWGGPSGDRQTIGLIPGFSQALALHEFGHAIGLHHVAHGVMQHDGPELVFSADDMAEGARVGVCGGSED